MTISAEASGVPEAADEPPPEPEPEPQAASARAAATARAAPSGARRERRVLTGVSFREGRAAVCRAWGWVVRPGVGRGAVGRGAWVGAALPGGPEPDRWVGNSRGGTGRRARGGGAVLREARPARGGRGGPPAASGTRGRQGRGALSDDNSTRRSTRVDRRGCVRGGSSGA